ncbi:MAG: alpha/beta hydrolase [Bacteroidota bacterium]
MNLSLADGRNLAYEIYGTPDGFPILGFHGTPGSRLWFSEEDPLLTELNLKLITLDRPGYGGSDPVANRSISAFNQDVGELIKHLDLDRFSLFGISGGGAYAAAFAAQGHRGLHKVGLVASIGQFKNGKAPKEMCWPNRIAFRLAHSLPFLIRFSYQQQKSLLEAKPEAYKKSTRLGISHLCPSDQEVLQKPEVLDAMVMQMTEAFTQGVKEIPFELKLLSSSWEFDLAAIKVPTFIWHGTEDTLSPISSAIDLAAKISTVQTFYQEGKGHFLDEDPEVWEHILQTLSS